MAKRSMAGEFLSSRQNVANDFAESRGVDHWTRFSSGLQQQADDFGNYLNSGNYTTADTEKYRSSANKAVEDLTAEMGRYGKNSNNYKYLDNYLNFYQNSLNAFDRIDVGTKAMDYYQDQNTWRPQEDYAAQAQTLQDSIAALESEMEAIEDKNSADYKSLESYRGWYKSIAENMNARAKDDSYFEDESDYAAFQKSTDYAHVANVRKTLKEKVDAIEQLDPALKGMNQKQLDTYIASLESDYVGLQAYGGDPDQINELGQKIDQLRQLSASGDLQNLDAMKTELARLDNYGDQIIRSVNYGGYDPNFDYQKKIDELREARQKTEEGSKEREEIDAQVRALAGKNGDGTNDEGLYDENTWLGRQKMEKFDVAAAQKRIAEIDQELEDRGLAKSKFWAKLGDTSVKSLDVDENGNEIFVENEGSAEADPEVMALRNEKRELTQQLNSSERLQKRSKIEKDFSKLSEEELAALIEEGKKYVDKSGYRNTKGTMTRVANLGDLDDEMGGEIRDYLLAAIGAEHLGKEIGYTAEEAVNAYEAQINDIAGYKMAKKISDIDSDFVRWNAQVLGVGGLAGLNQFAQGVKQTFSDDYVAPNKITTAGAYTREDLKRYGDDDFFGTGSNLSQVLFDTTQTTANMLPMIAASALASAAGAPGAVPALLGAGLMGVSSSGNSYNQALAEGWDKADARAFSIVMGAAEAGMQYLIGGISALGGVTEEGLLNAAKGINSAAVRFAAETGVHILSETTEELAQNRLERYLQYDLFGKGDADWMSWNEDDWYTVIVTALSTGAMEAPGTLSNISKNTKIGKMASGETSLSDKQLKTLQSKKALNRNAQLKLLTSEVGKAMKSSEALTETLALIGANMPEDTAAHELAARMKDGKIPNNATNLGELFSLIVAENNVGEDGKPDIERTMVQMIGGAVRYNEIQRLTNEQEAAKAQLAEVKANNPGAAVLNKTASALANSGADPILAVKTASVIDKVRNGQSISDAEMAELTSNTTEGKAARVYLASVSGDTNLSADSDAAVTEAIVGKIIENSKQQKALMRTQMQNDVLEAALEAGDQLDVTRATAGAERPVNGSVVTEGDVQKLQEAKRNVASVEQQLARIESMTLEELGELDAETPKGVNPGEWDRLVSLKEEQLQLENKIRELSQIKVRSKAQNDELTEARSKLAENRKNYNPLYKKIESLARDALKSEEKTETAPTAASNAEAAQSSPDVLTDPFGHTITREQFVKDYLANDKTNSKTEADANAEFDKQVAMSGTTAPKTEAKAETTEKEPEKKPKTKKKSKQKRAKLTGSIEYWSGGAIDGIEYDSVNVIEATKLLGKNEMAFVKDVLSKIANITLIKSKATENGYAGAQGIFYSDGRIYLDVNAGLKEGEIGQRSIVLAAAHELTHFIRAYNEEAFNALKSFVFSDLESKGMSIEERINKQKDAYRATSGGRELPTEAAEEEIVADACEMMLTDADQIRSFAEQHKTAAKTIMDWISEFFQKIGDAFSGLVAQTPEARVLGDSVFELRDKWLLALSGANENAEASSMDDLVRAETNADGEVVAATSDNGQGVFSLRTYDEGGRAALDVFLAKQVKKGDLDQTQADQIRDQMEALYNVCKEYDDGTYGPFSAWSNASVVEIDGRPVFSVVKTNGEYKLNLDFSLVCKKRRALDAVFNEMISRGIMNKIVGDKAFLEMGQASIAQINNIIREHGFETACALCFVDSKRFRQAMIADAFVQMYNEQVNSLVEGTGKTPTHFNYGGDTVIAGRENSLTGIDGLSTYQLNWSRVNEILKNGKKGSVEYKIAQHLKKNPSARKLMSRGDLMSTAGFDALNATNPELLKLYNSKKGAGGPKAAQSDVQYLNDIINRSMFNEKAAYEVGGVRLQSFSDYVGRLVFDYIQMMGDLAAKKLPAHAYTKEFQFAQQFGLTGVKINMSLVPRVVEDGVAPGLDKNGNYAWMDGQSFGSTVYDNNGKRMTAEQGFQLAIQIQNADGYSRNCGTIAVGVSNEHILKMLDDPNIRMVIPYHRSGINHLVAAMNQIDQYTDYTDSQNTRKFVKNANDAVDEITGENGHWVKLSKKEDTFNWNSTLQQLEREGKGAREAAQAYIDWCEEHNYLPKFSEFAYHPNYYKVLEDFTAYDKDGTTPAPLSAVQMNFPTEGSAFGSMQDLIKAGLEEDAMLQAKQEKGVQDIVNEIERELPGWESQLREQGEQFAIESGRQSLERTQMRDENAKSTQNYNIDGKAMTPKEAQAVYSSRDTQYNDWAPEFYSKMQRTVEDWTGGNGKPMGAKMAANQVLSWLKGKGVKAEEIKWSGIVPYLDGKKTVTKDELLAVMAENEIKIETKVLGGRDAHTQYIITDTNGNRVETPNVYAYEGVLADALGIPERMIVTNLSIDSNRGTITRNDTGEVLAEFEFIDPTAEPANWEDYSTPGGENYREILFKQPGLIYSNDAMDTHWDEAGILAHTRVQDMKDPWGGRILFIEEIQSDLHNAGANENAGFLSREDFDRKEKERNTRINELSDWISENREKQRSYNQKTQDLADKIYKKLLAPGFLASEDIQNNRTLLNGAVGLFGASNKAYLQSWRQGFDNSPVYDEKAADFDAAAKEFIDYILTKEEKAEMTSAREFLVNYRKKQVARHNLQTTETTGTPDVPFAGSANTYHEYVMKHLLRLAAEGDYDAIAWTPASMQIDRWENRQEAGYGVFRALYDNKLVQFMNKYGKQWGSKTETLPLENGSEVWSAPITDEMRKSVLETGQPLFSSRSTNANSSASSKVTVKDLNDPSYRQQNILAEDWIKSVKDGSIKYTKEMEDRWGLAPDMMETLDKAIVELLDKIGEINYGNWYSSDLLNLQYWDSYTNLPDLLDRMPTLGKTLVKFMLRHLNNEQLDNIKFYTVNTQYDKNRMRKAINELYKIAGSQSEAQSQTGLHKGKNLNVDDSRDYTTQEIRAMFEELNSDKDIGALGKKVFDWAEMMEKAKIPRFIPFRFKSLNTDDKRKKGGGLTNGQAWGGKVRYDTKVFNDPDVPNQRKAGTLLHEIIHYYTSWAIQAVHSSDFNNPYVYNNDKRDYYSNIPKNVVEAVKVLDDIYAQIKNDPLFVRENLHNKGSKMYGVKDTGEMVAELANPEFREALKKKSLLQRILDAVKKLFGIKVDNALDATSRAFETIMMASYDPNMWTPYQQYATTWWDKDAGSWVNYSSRGTEDPSNPYPKDTLENDIFNVIKQRGSAEDLTNWIAEKQTEYDEQQENAKERPPRIPTKGFAPSITPERRETMSRTMQNLINKYGPHRESEKSNGFVIAKKNQSGENLRKGIQNIASAKSMSQTAQDHALQFTLTNVKATYVPDSNKDLIKGAKEEVRDMGYETSLKVFQRNAKDIKHSTKDILKDIALGEQLLLETASNNDMANFVDVLATVAELGTTIGKSLQAFRLLKQSGPIGQLYYVQKAIDRLNRTNEDLIKRGKASKIVAKDALCQAVLTASDEKSRDEAMDALIKDIASQAPVTLRDRWNAWRYLAMLGNVRTHLRNVVGNAVFVPLRYAKDLMAAGGELLATNMGWMDETDRRKAVTVPRELRDFAQEDAEIFKKELQGNGKYNPIREILEQRQVLPSFLDALSKFNGQKLEDEDWAFLRPAYVRALSQQLTHSGYTIEQLTTTKEGQQALNEARKNAILEAQKATYRDFSAVASWLNRGKQMKGAGGVILSIGLEGVLPFTKTPVNILKRGVEYSPIGIAKGIAEILSGIKNGDLDVAAAIDTMCAGLTGTGIAAIGFLLANMGVLRGKKKDDDEENFDKLRGAQDYSIQIGSQSFTIDWAAPTALPLFVGAAVSELRNSTDEDGLQFKDAWNAIMMIAEPMTSLSMLDGLNSIISSTSYASDNEKLATIASTAATSYLGQAFPTILGQLARSIDGTRRSTYVDKNSPIPAAAQRFVQSSVQNKIPGWENAKVPYIDAWGRTSEPTSKVLNAVENFFAPWYRSVKRVTDVDEALDDLYKKTGAEILPKTPEKSFKVDGQWKHLTPDEWVPFATDVGQTKYDLMTQMISDPRYLALDDAQKAKVIKEYVYKYSLAAGKFHIAPEYDIRKNGAVWIQEAEAAATPYARFERIWEAIEKGLKL